MRIDFHSHVKISKKSAFHPHYFEQMIEEAEINGLDAICLTEHFNTIRFFDVYDYLDEHYQYVNDYYDVNGFKVFPGMEVDVKEGGHTLVIGQREVIRSIRKQLEPYTVKGHFIGIDQLNNWVKVNDCLFIGAHFYRESTPLVHLTDQQLQYFDALDLNGKDLYSYDMVSYQQKLTDVANRLDLPIVGGSDTHHFLQYGVIYNTVSDVVTIEALKEAVMNHFVDVTIDPSLSVRVKAATIAKQYLKRLVEVTA
jgi:hypothetical protein